jgi:uncharacterized protein YaiI (UPF0178 family)
MTTIFIDADACPVTRDAISVARARHIPVVLVCDTTGSVSRYVRPGVDAVQVTPGRDSADFAIIERLSTGDVVVTQDIGLAAMALGGGAAALSPRGRVFTKQTIDMELEVRHAEQRHRRAGGRTRGPSPFEDEDREHFVRSLERVLDVGPQN